MERCEECGRAVAPEWKFCVYCGRGLTASAAPDNDQVPAAIRPRASDLATGKSDGPSRSGQYSGTFWVAIAMGATGLVVIIIAVIQMANV